MFIYGLTDPEEWQIALGDELQTFLDEQHKKWPEIQVNTDGSGYTVKDVAGAGAALDRRASATGCEAHQRDRRR